MGDKGIPAPQLMLVGAIVFLIAGSLSVIVGFKARIGATLLLIFLVLATYYFHDFWNVTDPAVKQDQMIHFLKNVGLMGAMVLIIANGTGPMSLDEKVGAPLSDDRDASLTERPGHFVPGRGREPCVRGGGTALLRARTARKKRGGIRILRRCPVRINRSDGSPAAGRIRRPPARWSPSPP